MNLHTPECFASHLGLWAIEAGALNAAVNQIKAGVRPILTHEMRAAIVDRRGYGLAGQNDRVAVIPIMGEMTKGVSKYGGASSLLTQRAVRSAAADKSVEGILLVIDSPGGQVAGVDDLASEVARANKTKPVFAQIEDLGASAAYWVASQARRLAANRTAQIGSIGVFAVIEDSSVAAEMDGVTVHVISTGAFKGAGVPGAPVTEDQIGHLREIVDGTNQLFLAAIRSGRRLTEKQAASVADGRTWLAADALNLKLIDVVQSTDATLAELEREIDQLIRDAKAAGRQRNAAASVAMMKF